MEETFYGYRFLLLVLIVAANGFFAASEVALVSVRPSRLRQLADEGRVGAQAALNLLANPERLLSVVQVGVTLASLGLGWAGQDSVYRFLTGQFSGLSWAGGEKVIHTASFAIGFLLISFVHVVLGEVVPKNLAYETSDRLAILVAPPLLVFYRAVEPFVFIIERSSAVLSRLIGLKGKHPGGHSAEELKLIVSLARRDGELLTFEEQVIHRVLDLEDVSVREIMVPRNQIVSISCDDPIPEILRKMLEHQYSRVPVYEGQPEHIIGILHYKDLLKLQQDLQSSAPLRPAASRLRLRTLLRKPPVVPETKPAGEMIDEFRRARVHMAIVVDEFGTVSGLVTLEDVLEQLFGEIEDEHDLTRHAPSPLADTLELDGATSIRDLETQYGIELPSNAGFETLAGFLLYRLGYIPKPGDRVTYGGRLFTVLEMDRNRIAVVRVERAAQTPPG